MNTVPYRLNEEVGRARPGSPRRVDRLAVLPVFFRLDGRKVVVAGGSDAAAWKAELLASAGAEVHIYTRSVGSALLGLSRSGRPDLRFHLENREWDRDVFDGACLAVGDLACDGAAGRFQRAAHAAGVPVNVIDNPAYCDFQFGSIVNRSPVVVGISTDGAAPILGQAIRRRIETLLPASLAGWGRLAHKMRASVMKTLSPGRQRRLFWERFVDQAFAAAPDADVARKLLAACQDEGAVQGEGCLTVIHAPFDNAEQLTIKAMRHLQAADLICHEEAVCAAILELARREAERRCVSIGDGRSALRVIEEIHARVRAGMNVVLLLSTDVH